MNGLPDLDRFPDTFGYPPISGGSGSGERESKQPDDALPYGSMPLEELRGLTRTWSEPIKRMVIDARLMSSEQRAGLERAVLADIAFIEAERVRRLGLTPEERAQEDLEDERASQEAREKWLKLYEEDIAAQGEMIGEDGASYDSRAIFDQDDSDAETDDLLDKKDVGIGDLYQWHLGIARLSDAVLDQVIRSFPEYQGVPESLYRRMIDEARRYQQDETD